MLRQDERGTVQWKARKLRRHTTKEEAQWRSGTMCSLSSEPLILEFAGHLASAMAEEGVRDL